MSKEEELLPFFFSISVTPTAATLQASDIKGGVAHVWVMASSYREAESKALAHLMDYAWIAGTVEFSQQPPADTIARLGGEEKALLEKALRQGIASELLVWPKDKRPPDTPIEVRSMGPPPTGGSDRERGG